MQGQNLRAKKGQGQNIEGKKQQKTRAKLGEENEKNKIYLKNRCKRRN